MEINEAKNSKLKQNVSNNIIQILLNNKLITDNELTNLTIEFGYIFTKDDGVLEALMKTSCNNKVF